MCIFFYWLGTLTELLESACGRLEEVLGLPRHVGGLEMSGRGWGIAETQFDAPGDIGGKSLG